MKIIISVLLLVITANCVLAQTEKTPRHVPLHTIGKDSVNLSLNENYNRIEDSCATLIRYGHALIKERKYIGKFKDVSQLDTSVLMSQGEYTADGLKTGLFTAWYINGELQSKGVYKNNNYDGHWEVYYDDGNPEMVFEAVNDTVRIISVWDAEGKKTVENGKGTYTVTIKPYTWKGKLENGRPDGTWHAYKTDDATQTDLVEEYFKKGVFHDGKSPVGKYTNESHILLINPDITFPYTRAEKFLIATVACNMVRRKHIVNAQYAEGRASLSNIIARAIGSYLSRVNTRMLSGQLTLQGVVNEAGLITDLKPLNAFDDNFVHGIVASFHNVPGINPATADGKPIRQGFRITISFENGNYRMGYRFLPIDQSKLK